MLAREGNKINIHGIIKTNTELNMAEWMTWQESEERVIIRERERILNVFEKYFLKKHTFKKNPYTSLISGHYIIST